MKNLLAFPISIAFAAASGLALAVDAPANSGTAPSTVKTVKSAAPPTTSSQDAAVTRKADNRNEVRDWAQIDVNKDHSISPEEMEAYLLANPGPLKGK